MLGSRLLGWDKVCAVEIDPYCREILLQRQKEGCLEKFPIWDDVKTFNGWPWRGKIDVVSGGFPCQDISPAGKGVGITGSRSGLVFEMLRIVAEVQPRFIFAENSPQLRTKGLGIILQQLAEMGYDARWGVLGAWHVGAPHRRDRLWVVASNANGSILRDESRWGSGEGWKNKDVTEQHGEKWDLANAEGERRERGRQPYQKMEKPQPSGQSFNHFAWPPEPNVGRVAYGVARRMDRLRAIGNGQFPRVVKLAWRVLKGT